MRGAGRALDGAPKDELPNTDERAGCEGERRGSTRTAGGGGCVGARAVREGGVALAVPVVSVDAAFVGEAEMVDATLGAEAVCVGSAGAAVVAVAVGPDAAMTGSDVLVTVVVTGATVVVTGASVLVSAVVTGASVLVSVGRDGRECAGQRRRDASVLVSAS